MYFEMAYSSFFFLFEPSNANVINPIALRKAKIVYNFGLSECNWVKMTYISIFWQ